jgi:hypothetical protein
VGSFRHPVGPLPGSVYWRRRIVLLGIPLFVIALVAYACTGTSGTPTNNAGAVGGNSPSAGQTGVITPAPSETSSGSPGGSYPTGNGPSGSGSAGAGGTGGSGATGSGGGSGGNQTGAGGAALGCALSLTIALDRTSGSTPVQYPGGTYPTFKITAKDAGSANCTVDASGKGMVVSVMPLGTTTPVWTSATCSGAADLRVLGPGDAQTFPVEWKRWQSQGTTCPASKLPTVPAGTYTVNVEANGVTSSQVEFVLD